jgi:hypothetical protein
VSHRTVKVSESTGVTGCSRINGPPAEKTEFDFVEDGNPSLFRVRIGWMDMVGQKNVVTLEVTSPR